MPLAALLSPAGVVPAADGRPGGRLLQRLHDVPVHALFLHLPAGPTPLDHCGRKQSFTKLRYLSHAHLVEQKVGPARHNAQRILPGQGFIGLFGFLFKDALSWGGPMPTDLIMFAFLFLSRGFH